MIKQCRVVTAAFVGLVGWSLVVSFPAASTSGGDDSVNGVIWVANRGAHTIRGFDAGTGAVLHTVSMAPNSQPGDLAYATGKISAPEEFCTLRQCHRRRRVGRRDRPHPAAADHDPSRACGSGRQSDRRRTVRDRPGRGGGYARRHAARAVGQQHRDHERPRACRRVLERRQHTVSGERRVQRSHRDRSTHRRGVLAHDRSRRARAGGDARREDRVRQPSNRSPARRDRSRKPDLYRCPRDRSAGYAGAVRQRKTADGRSANLARADGVVDTEAFALSS